MLKRVMSGFVGAIVLVSMFSVSVFAATREDLKSEKEGLKASKITRQNSLEGLKQAASTKLEELGAVKLTPEQKTQVKDLRDQLKPLKDQKTALKAQLEAALDAQNSENVKAIRTQIKTINAQIKEKIVSIKAITGGKNENAAQIKAVKGLLKDTRSQKEPIINEAKNIRTEIKSLFEQLKTAKKAGDTVTAASITDQIISKYKELTNNLEQRTNINNQTSASINQ
jgi:DNA-binding ferritin-like protein